MPHDNGAARDGEYRAVSDEMMDMLAQLRDIESRKRQFELGSDPFIELAKEAERLSRLIFRWSGIQAQLASESPAARSRGDVSGTPIEHIVSRPLDRILADWRQAQLRFELAPPKSPEAEQAANDVERLREEFRLTQARQLERERERERVPDG